MNERLRATVKEFGIWMILVSFAVAFWRLVPRTLHWIWDRREVVSKHPNSTYLIVAVVIVAAVGLYRLRRQSKGRYGFIEVSFGALLAWYGVKELNTKGDDRVEAMVALLSILTATYVIVEGLEFAFSAEKDQPGSVSSKAEKSIASDRAMFAAVVLGLAVFIATSPRRLQAGDKEQWLYDSDLRIVWSTQKSTNATTHEAAESSCRTRSPRGRWRLPTAEEVDDLGSSDDRKTLDNLVMTSLNTYDARIRPRIFWTVQAEQCGRIDVATEFIYDCNETTPNSVVCVRDFARGDPW